MTAAALFDGYQRRISYLRVSVTDRCDLRCVYCMPQHMRFLPRADLLSFEELDRLTSAFVAVGVRKLRITGGEPLVRKDIMTFLSAASRHLETKALDELTLTTNATHLAQYAKELRRIGIRRVNVSLDSLDRETFARIARRDMLPNIIEGIEAARAAGLHVKLNVVALKHDNAHDIPHIIQWAHARGMDVSLIETMPLGDIDEDRTDQFISLADIRATLASFWTLQDTSETTGGPSRYVRIRETGGRLGFITPLSHNFCDDCNRVRLTCTGRLYMCLGQDDHVDFRDALRAGASDDDLRALLLQALAAKPKAHEFAITDTPALARHMSTTGG